MGQQNSYLTIIVVHSTTSTTSTVRSIMCISIYMYVCVYMCVYVFVNVCVCVCHRLSCLYRMSIYKNVHQHKHAHAYTNQFRQHYYHTLESSRKPCGIEVTIPEALEPSDDQLQTDHDLSSNPSHLNSNTAGDSHKSMELNDKDTHSL